jgi:hypothetical protein
MEVAIIPPPASPSLVPSEHNLASNLGAWIFLALVFMCGMLFQACVPRLCHLEWVWGGKVKTFVMGCKHCWPRATRDPHKKGAPEHLYEMGY